MISNGRVPRGTVGHRPPRLNVELSHMCNAYAWLFPVDEGIEGHCCNPSLQKILGVATKLENGC